MARAESHVRALVWGGVTLIVGALLIAGCVRFSRSELVAWQQEEAILVTLGLVCFELVVLCLCLAQHFWWPMLLVSVCDLVLHCMWLMRWVRVHIALLVLSDVCSTVVMCPWIALSPGIVDWLDAITGADSERQHDALVDHEPALDSETQTRLALRASNMFQSCSPPAATTAVGQMLVAAQILVAQDCVICRDPIEAQQPALRCSICVEGLYHSSCIERWMKRSNTCPVCRQVSQLPCALFVICASLFVMCS